MEIFHHSCGFVVFYEGIEREYLLLRYPEGHIDLVKGHREESDENELVTAKRELLEETGITEVEVVQPFFMSINYEYKRSGEKHKKQVDFFLGEVFTKEIKISHEHTEFIWLNYEKALQAITFDNARDVLIAAESFLQINTV